MSGQNLLLLGAVQQAVSDPYYEYTTLLLPGNGTNGAQNNTFLDSSTNAFTITRNGNTTQGTFSPFSQTGWGNYCSGTTDSFSVASNATLSFGTGDFTIEFWIFRTGTNEDIVFEGRSTEPQIVPHVQINPSGYALFYVNGAARITGTTVLSQNTWYHVAVARSGTNTKLFVNGTQEGSTYSDSNNYTIASTVFIGRDYLGSANAYLQGYLSNLRAVKGTAVYTSNFTPPTSALTAISGTSLLMSQSNRFVDNSTNAFAITVYGSPSIQAFSPFNPTAAWSAATNGGSGYFDGSGDSLSFPTATAQLGTSDFSLEAWVYPTNGNDIMMLEGNTDGATIAGSSFGFYAQRAGNNSFIFYGGSNIQIAAPAPIRNAWNHIVYARSSNIWSCFLNGTRVSFASANVAVNNGAATHPPSINRTETGSFFIAGYRFLLGSSAYDATQSTITVPTSLPTAVTNTKYLLNFTNAGIFDATSKNDLETVGNAQISTTQSKFGGSSMYFDGTGDYLVSADSENWNVGSGDFTTEAWIYPVSFANEAMIMGQWSGATGGTTLNWALMFDAGSAGYLRLITSSNGSSVLFDLSTSTFALSLNTWQHIAAVKYGSTYTIYVNGVSRATTTNSSALYNATNPFTVGAESATPTQYFNGYIDDLRVTKGIARYTANFTPPTSAFPLL